MICSDFKLFYSAQQVLVWQPLTNMVNDSLSSLLIKESYEDYKRTQQEVSNILLLYILMLHSLCYQ